MKRNCSKILWSPLLKVQLFRKKVLLVPFSLFNSIQSKYATKSLQMKSIFTICLKLNSIVWLFGIWERFLKQGLSLYKYKRVRNWKINKIYIWKFELFRDPGWVTVKYLEKPLHLDSIYNYKVKEITLGTTFFSGIMTVHDRFCSAVHNLPSPDYIF